MQLLSATNSPNLMRSLETRINAAFLKLIRARHHAPAEAAQGSTCAAVTPAKLRPAQFSDFEAVAQLKQRGGMAADSIENWVRLWRHNPALSEQKVERPIGWVLEADGAIVGYLGNISLLYRFGDKTLTAVTAHGLVVDPAYRAMSITLVSAFFRQKSVDLFVSTSAIEAVGKIALAFKSSPLPQADYDTALFWVLNPYSFACGLMRKLKLPPVLAHISAVIAAFAIAVDKLVRRRLPRRSPASQVVTEIAIDEIGKAFGTLWEEKRKEKVRLLADRTPATLRWHFKIPGDRGSARALCCYQDQELIGYAVVRSDANPQNGLRTSIIADMVAKNDDPEVVRSLWLAAYKHAGDTGSDVLEVLGFPSEIRNVGAEWNPYRRKYPACPFYYKATDPELHRILANGSAWYASPYDGDATLIRPSYSSAVLHPSCPVPSEIYAGHVGPNAFQAETTEVY
jgi:hypothetical protein